MAYSNDEFMEWVIKRDFEKMKQKVDEERNTKNYVRFTDFSFLYRHYAYLDVADYYADEFFDKHKVRVVFGREMVHPEHSYRVVFVKVPKWREYEFKVAMEELKQKMLICGHTDYLDHCKEITSAMAKE